MVDEVRAIWRVAWPWVYVIDRESHCYQREQRPNSQSCIETDGFYICQSLHSLIQRMWRIQPSDRFSRIHLDSSESLRFSDLGLFENITWSVASHPEVSSSSSVRFKSHHPYTLHRSRTLPPSSCQTGTPRTFPFISLPSV